jgi:cyclophilin family peptidyl-prolyl cis-trans isomerase/predicted DsbA family dithiol-disulfide isomerase
MAVCLSACGRTDSTTVHVSPTASLPIVQLGPTSTPPPSQIPTEPAFPTPTLLPIPPISDSDHSYGDPNAPVTLVVYGDFQCPYCANFYHAWKQIQPLHPRDLRLIFRHFPLIPIHDKADLAGSAAEIAGRENRFWEMHDALFERRDEWAKLSRDAFIEWVSNVAGSLELDSERFKIDLTSGEYQSMMLAAYQGGNEAGIPGTPFIFFNGEWYRLSPNATNLEASIRLEILSNMQYSQPPLVEFHEGELVFAHLELDQGEIVIQLFPEHAPATVASFIFLAEQGWFEGSGFYSVEPGISVEAGDPSGTGLGGPGYLLLDEVSDTLSFDEIGMLAMSSSGPNTNGSRFFINLTPLPHLNGSRTIFGRVLEGLNLLKTLRERDPYQDLFQPYELTIQSVSIDKR